MNNKSLKFVFILVLVVATVFASIMGYKKYFDIQNVRGQHTFDQVRKNLKSLARIEMISPEYGKINIYRHDNSWRFKEASDYFVNERMLANFYNMVNDSVVISVQEADKNTLQQNGLLSDEESSDGEGQGTEIAIYDNENNLLSNIIIGNRIDEGEYVFARTKNKKGMYVISAVGGFSGDAPAWIPYPLIHIDSTHVSKIILDDVAYSPRQFKYLDPTSQRVKKILEEINFVHYYGIADKKDFFASLVNNRPKKIQFNMDNGLVYVFYVYKVNDFYWLKIEIGNQPLIQRKMLQKADNTEVYYADWVFQLFDEDGEIFYGEDVEE